MTIDRSPNWRKHLLIPQLEIYKAVALSLDIDPDQIRVKRDSGLWPFDESQEFRDRIEVACANCGAGKGLMRTSALQDTPWVDEIALAQFATWAAAVGWKIPTELRSVSATNPAPTTDFPATQKRPRSVGSANASNSRRPRERAALKCLLQKNSMLLDDTAKRLQAAVAQALGVPQDEVKLRGWADIVSDVKREVQEILARPK